jgi:hypothetical protein
MIFLKKTFPFLLIAFMLSVVLRMPQLGRPLSKHHEFCTAVSLRILQNWWDEGIEKFNYLPATNFAKDADKFINNFGNATGSVVDAAGNYYYVSHPPLAYYVPYVFLKLINVRPDVVPLQLFNMLLHFLSAIFVYFIVCLLSFNRARSHLHVPSFVAFLFYLFAPATLWFQGNVYMSDMAVQLPFVIGVYIVLKMIIRQKFYVPKYIFFYSLVLFSMIYTSWLGVFFAIAVIVYSLLHTRASKGFNVLILLTIGVLFLTLRLIIYQYSSVAGLSALLTESFDRYLVRGSLGDLQNGFFGFVSSYLIFLKNLIYNYLLNYFFFYLIIVGFIGFVFSRHKLKITFSENGYRFMWLSVLPIALLHLLFLNYSEHDFTVLYASLFFSVLCGIFYDKIKKSGAVSHQRLNLIFGLSLLLLMIHFTVSNMPGSKNFRGERYDVDMLKGEYIAQQAKADEVVFMLEKPEPQLLFYAQRNIKVVKDTDQAMVFLQQRKMANGRIFSLKDGSFSSQYIINE